MSNPFQSLMAVAAVAIGSIAGLVWLAGADLAMPMRADDAPAVLIELFTSQGCSSCPPADALLAKLAKEPGVVAISRPVTYWDRLGWKDTLARPENTALQRAYTARNIAGAGVYTPQAVVQGGAGTVGSREGEIRTLAAQAASAAQIGLGNEGRVTIDGVTATPATVTVIALRSAVDVAIGRGENGGRHLRYANVVVGERPIGTWRGGGMTFAIPAAALSAAGADRYALVVRQGAAGKVLAARYL